MADERLRLVAEVQDQFTGPLDKLTTALRRTASTGSKTAKDIAKDFEGFQGTLGKATSTLQGMLSPLQSLGVAGLGAGLGLSGIATALRSFSSGTQQLSILSKESGLAVDQLRALSQLGDRFGVSAETMNSGVIHLSEGMRKLKMGYGELQTSLLAMNKGEFADKLFNAKDMQAALDAAMEELSKEKDSYKRRQLAEVIFGAKDFGVIAGQVAGKYREVMQEIIASQGVMTKETEKAAAEFEKNMSRMGSAAERLKLNTLGPLLKGLNTIIESGDRAGIRGNAEAMDKDLNTRLTDATKRRDELSKDPTKNADAIKSLEKEIRTLTDAIRRSKDGAGPSGVSAIPMSFSGGTAGSGGARIYTASLSGGGFGSGNAATMGGFGGPLPTLGGGFGGGNPSGSGGGLGRGYGGEAAPIGPTASTPRGNGQGTRGGARTADMMRYAMDQLRREGVPEDQLRNAAAHLVGQAHMESGLDPNKVHDGGTGYGIYGARDPGGRGKQRRSEMLKWLRANGYAPNSAEGQMRYMTHEAMNDPSYRATRNVLMGRGTGNVDVDTNTITRNFEAPKVINMRAGAVRNALRIGPSEDPSASAAADENGVFPNGAPRALKPLSMADDASVPGQVMGRGGAAGNRLGDAMMRRFYGDQAPVARGQSKGSLDITLHGFPAGTKPRASMDDLFKDVTVSKKRQLETTDI